MCSVGAASAMVSSGQRKLNQLVRAGVVERRADGGDVRYVLTPTGRELQPVVAALGVWGIRWIGEIGTRTWIPSWCGTCTATSGPAPLVHAVGRRPGLLAGLTSQPAGPHEPSPFGTFKISGRTRRGSTIGPAGTPGRDEVFWARLLSC